MPKPPLCITAQPHSHNILKLKEWLNETKPRNSRAEIAFTQGSSPKHTQLLQEQLYHRHEARVLKIADSKSPWAKKETFPSPCSHHPHHTPTADPGCKKWILTEATYLYIHQHFPSCCRSSFPKSLLLAGDCPIWRWGEGSGPGGEQAQVLPIRAQVLPLMMMGSTIMVASWRGPVSGLCSLLWLQKGAGLGTWVVVVGKYRAWNYAICLKCLNMNCLHGPAVLPGS